VVISDLGLEECVQMHLPLRQRAYLVCSHETAVARDVGRKDGREPPLSVGSRHDIHVDCAEAQFSLARLRRTRDSRDVGARRRSRNVWIMHLPGLSYRINISRADRSAGFMSWETAVRYGAAKNSGGANRLSENFAVQKSQVLRTTLQITEIHGTPLLIKDVPNLMLR
jgi:hypothetical protein